MISLTIDFRRWANFARKKVIPELLHIRAFGNSVNDQREKAWVRLYETTKRKRRRVTGNWCPRHLRCDTIMMSGAVCHEWKSVRTICDGIWHKAHAYWFSNFALFARRESMRRQDILVHPFFVHFTCEHNSLNGYGLLCWCFHSKFQKTESISSWSKEKRKHRIHPEHRRNRFSEWISERKLSLWCLTFAKQFITVYISHWTLHDVDRIGFSKHGASMQFK